MLENSWKLADTHLGKYLGNNIESIETLGIRNQVACFYMVV